MILYEHIFSDFRRGQIASFYERMYPELLAYALRMLGTDFAFLAEDCVQDAVFKAYKQMNKFTHYSAWRAFLYTCVHHEVMNIHRKYRAKKNYEQCDGVADNGVQPDLLLDMIEQETRTLLFEAIDHLPEKYRCIFEMSFMEGLKNTEIADQLQIAVVTVKKRKAKMIALLRKELKGKMDHEMLLSLLVSLSYIQS